MRLKNLANEAPCWREAWGRSMLANCSIRSENSAPNAAFWRGTGNRLAIFHFAITVLFFKLPQHFQEFVAVGRGFHVMPLASLLKDGRKSS